MAASERTTGPDRSLPPVSGQQATSPEDWLVQLVRAPAGAVIVGCGRAVQQQAENPSAEAETTGGDIGAAQPTPPEAHHLAAVLPSDEERQLAPSPLAPGSSPGSAETEDGSADAVHHIAVAAIQANPDQPRRTFDSDELAALAESIAEQGVIQPVVVRPLQGAAGVYQLVVGERRWRAAQVAGLAKIPAIVRSLDDGRTAEIALVENIQRADLPPLEEARAYAQLIERYSHTQDDLARRLGKTRSHIGHMLRLLRLPPRVQQMIADGVISVGHARILVNVSDPEVLAERVIVEGLSVRQTESAAKAERPAAAKTPAGDRTPTVGPDREAWAARFQAALERPVAVKPGRKGGSLVIRYDTEDDLAAILARIGGTG